MITLNNTTKINKPKIRVGRGIGSGKGKTSTNSYFRFINFRCVI